MPLWGLLRNQATLPHRSPRGAAIFSRGAGMGKTSPPRSGTAKAEAAPPILKFRILSSYRKGETDERGASSSDTSQRIIARRSLAHGEANSKTKTRRGGFSVYGVGQKGGRKAQKRLASGGGMG